MTQRHDHWCQNYLSCNKSNLTPWRNVSVLLLKRRLYWWSIFNAPLMLYGMKMRKMRECNATNKGANSKKFGWKFWWLSSQEGKKNEFPLRQTGQKLGYGKQFVAQNVNQCFQSLNISRHEHLNFFLSKFRFLLTLKSLAKASMVSFSEAKFLRDSRVKQPNDMLYYFVEDDLKQDEILKKIHENW